MADDKGPDEKVICVPVSDPIWNSLNDLSDMNPHLLKEIEHFFQVYKDLENKTVDVGGWGDVDEAYKIIKKYVQIDLIKLKINQRDYLVFYKYPDFKKKAIFCKECCFCLHSFYYFDY
jgi:hypothetical protein